MHRTKRTKRTSRGVGEGEKKEKREKTLQGEKLELEPILSFEELAIFIGI